jgi:hypothetical protein
MTLATDLSLRTLEKIRQRFRLREIGAPYLTLLSPLTGQKPSEPVGSVRLFTGALIHKMIYIGLAVPSLRLDSHMIFAFTPPESAVPHFTLDAVMNAPQYAFHLDLIPRVDLAANLAYLNYVYQPLTPEFEKIRRIEGLSPANVAPRQSALMSPWMLVYRATEAAFAQMDESVESYLNHWFNLVELGVPVEIPLGHSPAALAHRDQLNRAAIFNPEVDPVWTQVERLVGAQMAARLREIAKSQSVEE